MSKTYLIKSLLLLFALAPLTGCMMNPTDEYGVTFRNETFMPYGFTLNPEETIQFQVQHPRGGNWYTIATTSTGSSSGKALGRDWYYWRTNNIQIPSWGWTWHSQYKSTAEVRAVGSDGEPLWTFNYRPFDHWNPNGTLYDFWVNAGSGKQSATVICHSPS